MVEQVVLPSPAVPIIKPDGRIDDTWFQRLRSLASGTNTANTLASVNAQTTNYTAVAADRAALITMSGASTLSLDAAATLGDTWWIAFRNIGTRRVTIDPDGAELIDGAATVYVYPQQACYIYCDGSTFYTSGLPARFALGGRTLYVDAAIGSNSNDGLDAGSGGPFLTIQHAIDFLRESVDLGGVEGLVSVADGTYNEALTIFGNWFGYQLMSFTGNTTTPTNCVINGPSADYCLYGKNGGVTKFNGFYFTSTSNTGIAAAFADVHSHIDLERCDFATFTSAHVFVAEHAVLNQRGTWGLRGTGGFCHINVQNGGIFDVAGPFTTSNLSGGTLTFTTFLLVEYGGGAVFGAWTKPTSITTTNAFTPANARAFIRGSWVNVGGAGINTILPGTANADIDATSFVA